MKLTIRDIANMVKILSQVDTSSFKINYWASRNLRTLNDSYSFMLNERNKIYKKFLDPDESGNVLHIDEDNQIVFHLKEKTDEYAQEFENTMNELFNLDCEIEPYLIDINILMESDIHLSPEQISAIEYLLAE